MIEIENNKYELIENYRDCFDLEEFREKYIEYFKDYDYIVGDIAYSKLRLKGFCDKKNKLYNKINDIENLSNYIKQNCAYDCKYFVLKRKNV